jgi:hypothetical protein
MVHIATVDGAMSSGLGMPLTGTSINDDLHAAVANQHTYFIHLLTAVVLNTFVVRLYYADGRTYTSVHCRWSELERGITNLLAA